MMPAEKLKILNIGAGLDPLRRPGTVTLDCNPATNPDVLHDLNSRPWPFETDAFDQIICRDVIEHMPNITETMEEIHRVGRSGALVQITTPHFSCANSFTDPTHLFHLGLFSFDYFTGANQWGFYTKVRFKQTRRILYFYPGLFRRPIAWFANRYPEMYEKKFAWIFPAWFIDFEFEIIK